MTVRIRHHDNPTCQAQVIECIGAIRLLKSDSKADYTGERSNLAFYADQSNYSYASKREDEMKVICEGMNANFY